MSTRPSGSRSVKPTTVSSATATRVDAGRRRASQLLRSARGGTRGDWGRPRLPPGRARRTQLLSSGWRPGRPRRSLRCHPGFGRPGAAGRSRVVITTCASYPPATRSQFTAQRRQGRHPRRERRFMPEAPARREARRFRSRSAGHHIGGTMRHPRLDPIADHVACGDDGCRSVVRIRRASLRRLRRAAPTAGWPHRRAEKQRVG